ncbi:MAG: hypothetical protein EAZ55_00175 [Cytophagales bacterium]|nr:MAG: hypothetical protein EAZ55_00175 [Cytophagales bacterium]
MKNFVSSLLLTLLIVFQLQAQTRRMVSRNSAGFEEYLYFDYQNSLIYYANAQNKSKVKLTNVAQKTLASGMVEYQVKFPNSNDIYRLLAESQGFRCTNPDGSVQNFTLEDKYECKNANGNHEYLYLAGMPVVFLYNSVNSKNLIQLNVINYDMMSNVCKVSFPNESKIYTLEIKENMIACKNPDGSTQLFYMVD